VHLIAEYMDGSTTEGEAQIPKTGVSIRKLYITPADAEPTADALDAIADADIVILGPGSLFTSVIPNLVINGMADAVAKSSAFKIYVCNVMTQVGETEGYTASDHVKAIINHTNKDIVNACLINDAEVPGEALKRYKVENSYPVKADADLIRSWGYKVVATDLLSVNDFVRHDSEKLTSALIKIIESHRFIKR
jgi:uncharacterized cofD-like protein